MSSFAPHSTQLSASVHPCAPFLTPPPTPYTLEWSPALSDLSDFSDTWTSLPPPSPQGGAVAQAPHASSITSQASRYRGSNKSGRKNRHDPDYVARPPNPFILFRSAKCNEPRVIQGIAGKHTRRSQVIAGWWNCLSKEDRKEWVEKASLKRLEHQRKYPNYRFCPVARSRPRPTRRTRNNESKDKERDRRVGEALARGLEGEELTQAIEAIEAELNTKNAAEAVAAPLPAPVSAAQVPADDTKCSIFRSPLLPPQPLPGTPTGQVQQPTTSHGLLEQQRSDVGFASADIPYGTGAPQESHFIERDVLQAREAPHSIVAQDARAPYSALGLALGPHSYASAGLPYAIEYSLRTASSSTAFDPEAGDYYSIYTYSDARLDPRANHTSNMFSAPGESTTHLGAQAYLPPQHNLPTHQGSTYPNTFQRL